MPSYYLSPIGNDQQVSSAGAPLSGGKIFTYLAGTSTPSATYTDNTGATPQANPIILNSLGLPASPIWLLGGFPLKFIIKDSADVTIRTVDNISGINDTSSTASEWISAGITPTYISATKFSVVGDQTSIFQVNRRVRTTNTGGLIYGRITVTSFGAGITTVTVVNDTGSMDAGLSAVAYGFLSFTPSSVPFALYAAAGANTDITSLAGGNLLLVNNATTSKPIVRQTVLSGSVDTNGLPSFGGSTGSTTVIATSTLIATAANGYALGGAVDYTGSITNPSWTSLSTNGTMYLYLDIAAAGTCTTGSTTLAPTYRWGGADVATSGQFTFNIQEMVGRVGNGSAAVQTNRVFLGEVTVAGGVVTAIVWYALQGRFEANPVAMPAESTPQVYSHRLGGNPDFYNIVSKAKITSAVAGCAVGEIVDLFTSAGGTGTNGSSRNFSAVNRNSATFVLDGSGARIRNATTGADTGASSANTNLLFSMDRGWR